MRMSTCPPRPCNELLNRHLPPQLAMPAPALGNRQLTQERFIRPRFDQRRNRIDLDR